MDFQDIFNLWRIRNDARKKIKHKKQMLISDYFITLKAKNHGRYNTEIFFLFLILWCLSYLKYVSWILSLVILFKLHNIYIFFMLRVLYVIFLYIISIIIDTFCLNWTNCGFRLTGPICDLSNICGNDKVVPLSLPHIFEVLVQIW